MPRWVDTCRDGGVGLEVDAFHMVSVDDECAGIVLAHMEEHVAGVVVLIGVAVDALSFVGVAEWTVVVECGFVECGEVALCQCEVIVVYV